MPGVAGGAPAALEAAVREPVGGSTGETAAVPSGETMRLRPGRTGPVGLHADTEVAGETRQPGRIPLPDRPELPPTSPQIQLAPDERRLRRGLHLEARDLLLVPGIEQPQRQSGQPAEGAAIGRGAQDDPLDLRFQGTQVDLDGVRRGSAVPLLTEMPYGAGGVLRLVVEDEVPVVPHASARAEQQRRGIRVRRTGTSSPAEHGPHRPGGDGKVGALAHGCRCHGPSLPREPGPGAVRCA